MTLRDIRFALRFDRWAPRQIELAGVTHAFAVHGIVKGTLCGSHRFNHELDIPSEIRALRRPVDPPAPPPSIRYRVRLTCKQCRYQIARFKNAERRLQRRKDELATFELLRKDALALIARGFRAKRATA